MQVDDKKHAYGSKIAVKILVRFFIVAILPIAAITPLLVNEARNHLTSKASDYQQSLASHAAAQVDRYLNTSTDQLSLLAAQLATDKFEADESITALMEKNKDLQRIEVLTNERTKKSATRMGELVRIASTKLASDDNAVDMLADRDRVLSLDRNINNIPQLKIAMPIQTTTGVLTKTVGGIVGYYDMSESLQGILLNEDSTGSYTYVVNDVGDLAYYPDRTILSTNAKMDDVGAIKSFLTNDTKPKQTMSATDERVLSAAYSTQAGWGVIVESPISRVYGAVDSFTHFAVIIGLVAIIVAALLALSFSGQIILPLKRLVTGARKLSRNNLTEEIRVKSNDEIQELADILNGIGATMTSMVSNLQANNRDLSFEQSKLQSIINSVNDGVIAVNGHGEIMSVNASAMRLVGNLHTDVRGKYIGDLFPWTYEGKPLTLDFSNPGFHTYNDIVLAGGETVAYLDLMVEVVDREDNDVAAIITVHDQTSRRELNFLKLDFVAIAAHELRTPLTVISGYLDTLEREAAQSLSEDNIEDLKRAILGAGQLRELINKLLNIARIERGDMEIFLDKLDLGDLVARNVEQHQAIAAQRQQTLTLTSNTTEAIEVPADAASIVEVLNNLIGNALKYTPTGGHIHVNILRSTEEVYVEVIDNGPGVPESLRDKLFSKFYRAERNMISGTRGTGLGLFISKTIVELQRGTIGIKPDTGKGSVFYFTLPVYKPERDDASIKENVSRGKYGWFKKRSTH